MAAIPGQGKDFTDARTGEYQDGTLPKYTTAIGSTAEVVYFNPGPTDGTRWPFDRPLTLKEQRQETMKYFKSFKRR